MPPRNEGSPDYLITRARQEAQLGDAYRQAAASGSLENINTTRLLDDANTMRITAAGEFARVLMNGGLGTSESAPVLSDRVLSHLSVDEKDLLHSFADMRNDNFHPEQGRAGGARVSPDDLKALEQTLDKLRDLGRQHKDLFTPNQMKLITDARAYVSNLELASITDLQNPEKASTVLADANLYRDARSMGFVKKAAEVDGSRPKQAPDWEKTRLTIDHNFTSQSLAEKQALISRSNNLTQLAEQNASKYGGFVPAQEVPESRLGQNADIIPIYDIEMKGKTNALGLDAKDVKQFKKALVEHKGNWAEAIGSLPEALQSNIQHSMVQTFNTGSSLQEVLTAIPDPKQQEAALTTLVEKAKSNPEMARHLVEELATVTNASPPLNLSPGLHDKMLDVVVNLEDEALLNRFEQITPSPQSQSAHQPSQAQIDQQQKWQDEQRQRQERQSGRDDATQSSQTQQQQANASAQQPGANEAAEAAGESVEQTANTAAEEGAEAGKKAEEAAEEVAENAPGKLAKLSKVARVAGMALPLIGSGITTAEAAVKERKMRDDPSLTTEQRNAVHTFNAALIAQGTFDPSLIAGTAAMQATKEGLIAKYGEAIKPYLAQTDAEAFSELVGGGDQHEQRQKAIEMVEKYVEANGMPPEGHPYHQLANALQQVDDTGWFSSWGKASAVRDARDAAADNLVASIKESRQQTETAQTSPERGDMGKALAQAHAAECTGRDYQYTEADAGAKAPPQTGQAHPQQHSTGLG